jgi:hypothetical protein
MFDWLKSLFRTNTPEVEYKREADAGPAVVPAGPPTGQMPPGAPIDDPLADAKTDDDDRP